MPQAKNKKRATPSDGGAGGAGGAAAAVPTPARDLLTSQDVPPGLARRPQPARDQRPEQSIPAGLVRRPGTSGGAAQGSGTQSPVTQSAGTKIAVTQSAGTQSAGTQAGGARSAGTQAGGARSAGTQAGGARSAGKQGTVVEPAPASAAEAKDEADDVPAWAAKALEQLLTVTYWLDPGEQGDPFSATIRFTGQRTDVTGKSQPGDTFTQDETVDGIVPGSGPVAITAEVRGVNRGTWSVSAVPLAGPAWSERQPAQVTADRVPWPRRVPIPAEPQATLQTSTLLRSKVPGIVRYAYALLVALGVLTGLGLEALLLSTAHYPLLRPMMFSVAAVAAGVVGGKTWYAAVHRGRKWDGWCIQGFVAGAAVVVAAVAVAGPGLPAGAFLAAATPALLIGMGIGRHGCFWAGCCTGRPTASRWGIWSSDRHLGCRRMPVQLLEAWTALAVGTAALAIVLVAGLPRSGPVAVAGLAAYTLIRQFILGLRSEPRQWRYGRPVTATIAAIALIAGIALFAAS